MLNRHAVNYTLAIHRLVVGAGVRVEVAAEHVVIYKLARLLCDRARVVVELFERRRERPLAGESGQAVLIEAHLGRRCAGIDLRLVQVRLAALQLKRIRAVPLVFGPGGLCLLLDKDKRLLVWVRRFLHYFFVYLAFYAVVVLDVRIVCVAD